MTLNFRLNGRPASLKTDGDRRLIDLLREDFGLTGAKEGCGTGECGACQVLIDGESRLACLTLAAQVEGKEIVTIEGISADPRHRPLFEAFVKHGAVQCGYCSPAMVVASVDLLARVPVPDRGQIRRAISGNLCRCTGYQKIVDAVEAAAREGAEK
jgi:aerobic carbon-monoxide dehydrogenase small subunit